MKRNQLACALAALLLAPAASTAFAQSETSGSQGQQGATESNTKQLQAVTVTGSAIPRIDTETPSPVTQISAEQIQRSGFTTISDVVRSLSADNSGSIPNAFTGGFAAGSSGVALRGLTVNSTVVLIDGLRATSYPLSDDGQRSFVDLNSIPIMAVDHIEVLKDGASSLYGADAIAGVVNIILKPDFKGLELSADVGTAEKGGGFTRKATILGGLGDLKKDGYNVYVGVQYQQDNAISNGDRGFPYNTNDLSRLGGPNTQGGQPSQFTGSIYGSVTPGTLGTPGDITSGQPLFPGAPAQPLSACGSKATLVTNDPNNPGSYCSQNFVSQYDQIQAKMKEGGVYTRATFRINDTTKAYVSASYMETQTFTVLAPTQVQNATPNNTDNIALPPTLANGQLNPNNPFASQGQYALLNYAFGDIPRGTNYDNHNMRLAGGISGTLGDWNYNASLVGNHDSLGVQQFGYVNYNNLISAINNGTYNFINPAANSAAARSFLAPRNSKDSTSDLDALDLNANRELGDLPGGPMGVAVGLQYRYEAQNDPSLNPGNIYQGLGNAQTKGHRTVASGYFEFDMPLLQSLEMDVSGRFDHYSDVNNNFSPKVGLKWKPTDWIALRGTYSTGFRAPSFAENGSSSSQGFTTYQPPQNFQALHGNNGYVQPYQLSLFTQANPNIKPERAKNFTLGVVLQPTDWLSTSIDYYNIKKTNVITAVNPDAALANYYAGLPTPGAQVIADKPDSANPTAQPRPIEVISEYINANSLKTDGIDVDLQSHFSFSNGIRWISDLSATEIFNWNMKFPDGTVQSYVGTQGPYGLSSGAGTPRIRGSWANTMEYGPATITGTLYYTSSYKEIAEDSNGHDCLVTTPDGTPFPSNCHVGSYLQFDLTGSYQLTDKVMLTASVFNVFDRRAPFDPANYAGVNYNPTYSQYGAIGRFWNLGVKVKL